MLVSAFTVAPQWIVEPQDISSLVGNSVLIDCAAKGFPRPQITWLKAQGDLSQFDSSVSFLTIRFVIGKLSNDFQPIITQHGQIILLVNGSLWLENVSPQEEGQYLCRATNGIGSGLGKVIYLDINGNINKRFSMKTIFLVLAFIYLQSLSDLLRN